MPVKIVEGRSSCCGIYPFDPLSSVTGCCGSLLYNITTQVCCELGFPTEIVDGKSQCCGTVPFSPSKNLISRIYILQINHFIYQH